MLSTQNDRLETAVEALPQLRQYETLDRKRGQLTYKAVLNTLDQHKHIRLSDTTNSNQAEEQTTTEDEDYSDNLRDKGERIEDDTGTDTTTHRTDQEQGASNETTNTPTPPPMKDRKVAPQCDQGNTSRPR